MHAFMGDLTCLRSQEKLPGGRLTWILKQWGIDWAEAGGILCRENSTPCSRRKHGSSWRGIMSGSAGHQGKKGHVGQEGAGPVYTHRLPGLSPLPSDNAEMGRDSSPHILAISIFRGICSWRMIRTKVWRALQGYLTQVVLKAGLTAYLWVSLAPGLLADSVREALLINSFSTLVTIADTIVLLKPRALTK